LELEAERCGAWLSVAELTRLFCLGALLRHTENPIGQASADAREPSVTQAANGAVEDVRGNNGKTGDANETGFFQAGLGEVSICMPDDFINSGHLMLELRGDHADEPVRMGTWQAPQDKRWTQFASRLVSPREGEKDKLAVLDHLKDSLRSASV